MFVENEGKRTQGQAAEWRAMGGESGWCDLFLPLRLIAIECKSPTGTLSQSQRNHIDALRRAGWTVYVARTFDDVPDHLQRDPEGWQSDPSRTRLVRVR
jgi:hypothetical protein